MDPVIHFPFVLVLNGLRNFPLCVPSKLTFVHHLEVGWSGPQWSQKLIPFHFEGSLSL